MNGQSFFRFILNTFEIVEILDQQELTRQELESQLQIGKTTAYKKTKALHERDFIERDENGIYSLTPAGKTIISIHSEYRERLQFLQEHMEFFNTVVSKLDIPIEVVLDSEIICPSIADPTQPKEVINRVILESPEVLAVGQVIHPRFFSLGFELIAKEQLVGNLILDSTILDVVINWGYSEMNSFDESAPQTYMVENDLEYGLLIGIEETESVSIVIVLDSQGRLQGVLRNTTREGLDWAFETVDRLEGQAVELENREHIQRIVDT